MLEALIRTKSSPCSDKRAGDIICVKLKEFADWGSMERRVHMVSDWNDEALELSMRGEFEKTKVPPIVVTPYKECEHCIILDEEGKKIFEGNVTKTRSKKYFNIDLETQEEKNESEVSQEFEQNKEFARSESLKQKPGPPIGQDVPVSNNEQYLDYLNSLQKQLSKFNIETQIIDGKLVRV